MKMQSTQKDRADNRLHGLADESGQNFGLTEIKFTSMLQQMTSGDESLFEKVFLSQFDESKNYLMKRYGIDHSQAYDATMEALLKFRKRLLTGKIKYGNMRFLFTRMASQFLSESFNNKEILPGKIEIKEEPEPDFDNMTLDTLDKAWGQMGTECTSVLHQFYYKKIKLKTLALQLEKTETSIRKKKQRCLEKLRSLFLKYYQE